MDAVVEDEPMDSGGEGDLYDEVSLGGQVYSKHGLEGLYYTVLAFISQYGWYILVGVVLALVAWVKLKPYMETWNKKRREWADEQNFDPEREERYQDAMLRAREKMQRELEEKATEHQLNEEERKQAQADERIEQWEKFGTVTKHKKRKPKDDSRPPRSQRDYFPLGGLGGGGGYRPTRRMPAGGGG